MPSFPLFFGFRRSLIASRVSLAPEPVADKRFTDLVKIKEDIDKKRAALAVTLIDVPYYAQIDEIAVVTEGGKDLLRYKLDSPDQLSLTAEALNHFFLEHRSDDLTFPTLGYGHSIRDCLRILAVQIAANPAGPRLNPIYWHHPIGTEAVFVDPDECVVKAGFHQYLPPTTLWSHVGVRYPHVGDNALQQAKAVCEFITKLGLPE